MTYRNQYMYSYSGFLQKIRCRILVLSSMSAYPDSALVQLRTLISGTEIPRLDFTRNSKTWISACWVIMYVQVTSGTSTCIDTHVYVCYLSTSRISLNLSQSLSISLNLPQSLSISLYLSQSLSIALHTFCQLGLRRCFFSQSVRISQEL